MHYRQNNVGLRSKKITYLIKYQKYQMSDSPIQRNAELYETATQLWSCLDPPVMLKRF